MTPNDKALIKQLLNSPGWTLLEKEMRENAGSYTFQATLPEVDEHYRLILFAKSQGIEEVFDTAKDLLK